MEKIKIGNVHCDYGDAEEFYTLCQAWLASKNFHHVVTLNPEMVIEAENNQEFAQAVDRSDIRVPDGSGLIWARWYLRSKYWYILPSLIGFLRRPAQRIAGVDTVLELARQAWQIKQGVYLLGGTAPQVASTKKLLQERYPGLIVHTSPDHAFDYEGPATIIDDIRAKQPGLLFVAYGAPKQTQWIEQQRQRLPSVRIAVGVGGAFAILSEDTPRAPKILRQHNLEWAWRLFQQPQRLPRIWRATVQFPLLIHRQRKTRG